MLQVGKDGYTATGEDWHVFSFRIEVKIKPVSWLAELRDDSVVPLRQEVVE